MVKKQMNSLNDLIEEILNTPEVIEFKKLEKLVLEKEEIKVKLDRLHEVEKQAINAKDLGLENAYFQYMKEYKEILNSFENDMLVSSYLQSKEEVNSILNTVITIIERQISDKVNE